MTHSTLIILLLSILFCSGTCVLAVMLLRSNSSKDKLLSEMQVALRSLQSSEKSGDNALNSEQETTFFEENLRSAEITTKLQQPRLTVQQNSNSSSAPERYRYIQSLLAKGLSAEDIASTLSMSLHETTQIVALIRIATPKQLNAAAPPRPSTNESTIQSRLVPATEHAVQKAVSQAPSLPQQSAVVRKSIKLARWLKLRASSVSLQKKGGREPPRNPLPNKTSLLCDPLSGYT